MPKDVGCLELGVELVNCTLDIDALRGKVLSGLQTVKTCGAAEEPMSNLMDTSKVPHDGLNM